MEKIEELKRVFAETSIRVHNGGALNEVAVGFRLVKSRAVSGTRNGLFSV